jgi:hypothetical protein
MHFLHFGLKIHNLALQQLYLLSRQVGLAFQVLGLLGFFGQVANLLAHLSSFFLSFFNQLSLLIVPLDHFCNLLLLARIFGQHIEILKFHLLVLLTQLNGSALSPLVVTDFLHKNLVIISQTGNFILLLAGQRVLLVQGGLQGRNVVLLRLSLIVNQNHGQERST